MHVVDLAMLVHRPVHVPAHSGRIDQFRSEPLHPPEQSHVIHRDPALLDEAPDTVRKGVPQVPADRQQDDVRWEAEPGEG